ncbi:MAG: hypothetical protein FWE41_08545, partial [Coriobacteriia bacterium]|nr:hypothetical protein [Coriobacteriia bacterium]
PRSNWNTNPVPLFHQGQIGTLTPSPCSTPVPHYDVPSLLISWNLVRIIEMKSSLREEEGLSL